MCLSDQELNTSPQRMETNYVRFTGHIYHFDKDLAIQALCPKCAGKVGEFIRNERKPKGKSNLEELESRVPTTR